MNSLFFKRILLFVTFVTLFKVGISAQSKSVFLNLKVGQTTYQEAINQIIIQSTETILKPIKKVVYLL